MVKALRCWGKAESPKDELASQTMFWWYFFNILRNIRYDTSYFLFLKVNRRKIRHLFKTRTTANK